MINILKKKITITNNTCSNAKWTRWALSIMKIICFQQGVNNITVLGISWFILCLHIQTTMALNIFSLRHWSWKYCLAYLWEMSTSEFIFIVHYTKQRSMPGLVVFISIIQSKFIHCFRCFVPENQSKYIFVFSFVNLIDFCSFFCFFFT